MSPVDTHLRPTARWVLGHALPSRAMRAAGRRGDLQGQLLDHDVSASETRLQEIAEAARADGPLYRAKFVTLTASLPTVREVLGSSDFATGVFDIEQGPFRRVGAWAKDPNQLGPLQPPSLLVSEPPSHTRYRKLVTRVFSVRAVEALRARTEEIAAQLLDELGSHADARGEVDLVERYCALLPVTVIAEILGVPASERERVLEFGAAAAPSLDIGLGYREFLHVERSLAAFRDWLAAHLAALRDQPGDDLLSRLVAEQEDGVGLTDAELEATAGLVLAAGFETTVNLLGNGTVLLHEHPDQLERLRAEPDLWPNAVDEVLRIDPPVLLTGRVAARDTTVAGRRIGRGEVLTTFLAGANRDPDVFEHPDVFDVARPNARDHVSFSSGRHYCLGAALARMEGEVGLRALVERYPDLTLRPGRHRRRTRILRGWSTLPVALG
ncbi:cytochrome P450 [Nocardioides sp. CFH 31398]|uniref:cytochrome P450 n=1 Tax=Nocardioides sp. CFH 31398 TaxID=2919579 RepID=UPI001F0578A4|nr:cytochrome P450 [Nocardioides sp. CFH 31398]MCH1865051.1 cytochrome P450 [Nocardioides sp. CFH 31398]